MASYSGTTTLADCTVSSEFRLGKWRRFVQLLRHDRAHRQHGQQHNFASGNGGGLYDFIGTTTLNDVTFSGNVADNGGGVFDFFGTGTLANCTFSGNSASGTAAAFTATAATSY